jgi:aryl-alcohol dehydrogenase-like predicted oxidoreductase
VAIAWLIEQPAVGSVIVGIRSPEQARDNLAAGELRLGDEVLRRLDEATQPLKERLGANADMWQGQSRIR